MSGQGEALLDHIRGFGQLAGDLRARIAVLQAENDQLQRIRFCMLAEIERIYSGKLGRNLTLDEAVALEEYLFNAMPPLEVWPPPRIVKVKPSVVMDALYPFETETFPVDVFLCTDRHYTSTIRHEGIEFNWIKHADPERRTNAVNVTYAGTIDLALWTEEELRWLAKALCSLRNQTGSDWINKCLDQKAIPTVERRQRRPIASASSVPVPTP